VLDLSAGALSSKRTGFVAVLVPSINNSNFADTARGITEVIEDQGLQVLLGATDYDIEKEEHLVQTMLTRRPDGIIVTDGRHTPRARRMLQAAGIPVVEIWDLPAEPIDHVVGFSNAEASRALVHRLYQKGYRKIGFIGGASRRDSRGADRMLGYLRAIEELGLPVGRTIAFGDPPISMEQGGQAIVHLIEQWPDVDAAVCVSDLSAFGAIMEWHCRFWRFRGVALGLAADHDRRRELSYHRAGGRPHPAGRTRRPAEKAHADAGDADRALRGDRARKHLTLMIQQR
jgi:LacI family gluconate utilization system Gnt-I transcriptional repressor